MSQLNKMNKLNDILDDFDHDIGAILNDDSLTHAQEIEATKDCRDLHKAEILELIQKEIIGSEDWSIHNGTVNMNDETNQHIKVRNQLRQEQRIKAEQL